MSIADSMADARDAAARVLAFLGRPWSPGATPRAVQPSHHPAGPMQSGSGAMNLFSKA